MGNNPYEALERIAMAGYEFTGAGGDDDKSSTAGYEFAGGYEFTGAFPLLRPPTKPPVKPPAGVAKPTFNLAALQKVAPRIMAAAPPSAPPPAPMPRSVAALPIVNLAQLSAASRNAIQSAPMPPPPPMLNAVMNGPNASRIQDAIMNAPVPVAVPTTANGAPMMALAPPAAIGLPAPSGDLAPPNKPLPGGDSSALVSAARNGSKTGRAYQPQPINRGNSQMSNQPQLRETQPSRYREYPLGFATPIATPVPAGGTTSVTSQPQVVFRGVRLVVQSTIAPFFLINDIKVGKNSQLVSSNPLPADVFISTSVGVSLQMDTAQPGMTIALEVFNSDVAVHPFNAALIGSVME